MKGKLAMILVPILAIGGIVGTGFAVFHFGGGTSETFEIKGSNVELKAMVEKGTAKILNHDVPSLVLSMKDISMSDNLQIEYTAGSNWGEGTLKFYIDLEVKLTMTTDLASYVSVFTGEGSQWSSTTEESTTYYTYSKPKWFYTEGYYSDTTTGSDSTGTSSSSTSHGITIQTFSDWPKFSYQNGKRPTSTSGLKSMMDALKDDYLTYEFTLTLGDVYTESSGGTGTGGTSGGEGA